MPLLQSSEQSRRGGTALRAGPYSWLPCGPSVGHLGAAGPEMDPVLGGCGGHRIARNQELWLLSRSACPLRNILDARAGFIS